MTSGRYSVGGFLLVLRFLPPIKYDYHGITEISLKVALITTTLTPKPNYKVIKAFIGRSSAIACSQIKSKKSILPTHKYFSYKT